MAAISSLGSVLTVLISAVQTTIAGIRDIEFDPPEVETYEIDDLTSTHVDVDPTGRCGGGTVKASLFYDPAAAAMSKLITLFTTPATEVFNIKWGVTPASTQVFTGILIKQSRKAERAAPLMADIELKVARKPTLV